MLTGHARGLKHLQTGNNCWITTRLLSHLVKLNNLSELKYLRYTTMIIQWITKQESFSLDWITPKICQLQYYFCSWLMLRNWPMSLEWRHGRVWTEGKIVWIKTDQFTHWNKFLLLAFASKWMRHLKEETCVTICIYMKNWFLKHEDFTPWFDYFDLNDE